ncbi:MAG: LCP family protein, partial [Acidimicrobiaceae bacterium]
MQICVQFPSRDKNTGLYMTPGCNTLDGVEALAFARSRYFETKIDNEWKIDGTSDIGRGQRQRKFIAAMLNSGLSSVLSNPFTVTSAVDGVTGAII